jgi:phage tail-like protein
MWDDITSYLVGDRIIPITSNGYFYECITAGDSDSGEPTWPTTIGATVEDGTVVWETKNTNPGWETNNTTSRASDFTWDSEYMTHVLFGLLPSLYRGEDAKSDQVALEVQEDPDDDNERRAYHEDGTVNRGQLERFLMIFGSVASRIKGAIDFMAQLINADECPPKYLPRLASVLGVTIDGELPVDAQRAAIRNAVAIYRQKGTETGLERALRSAVDIANVNVDAMSKHVLVSNRVAKQSAIFAEKWEATKGYILGAVVAPSDNFGALGRVFECTTAGTSGGTEPQWVPAWVLNTAYSVGDVIVPTSVNGRAYVCTAAGTSAGTEPTWPTNLGETVVDGTVTWTVDNPPAAGFGATFSDGTAEWTTVIDESIYDWADSQAGHSWELPTFDSYGRVTAEANLYSFEILRLWFILASGEELTSGDTERIARMMNEFAPADTRYVIRVEGP